MIRIAVRLLQFLVVIWLTATVIFILFRVVPDHDIITPRTNNHFLIDSTREEYHLDDSLVNQYLWHLWNAYTLDLGRSFIIARGEPINEVVSPSLTRTLWMFTIVSVLSFLIGIVYEATASLARHRISRLTMRAVALVLLSAPVLGLTSLLWDLNFRLGGPLPLGYLPYNETLFGRADIWDRISYSISHGFMPVAACILLTFGFVSLMYRDQAARGWNLKNVPREMGRVLKSIDGNPLPAKYLFAWILSCVVIIDFLFGYHGIGTLLVDSVSNRDIPLIMALFFVVAMILIVFNTAFDVVRICASTNAVAPSGVRSIPQAQDVNRKMTSFSDLARKGCTAYRRSRVGMAALIVFLGIVFIAIAAPVLSTVRDPANPDNYEMPVFQDDWRNPLPPSFEPSPYTGFRHFLGTDQKGIDVYSSLLYGSREPLIACLTIGSISVLLGLLAGFLGLLLPPSRSYLMRCCAWLSCATAETFVAIPLLLMVFGVLISQSWGFLTVAVLVGPLIYLWASTMVASQVRNSPIVCSSAGKRLTNDTVVDALPPILARSLYAAKIAVVTGVLTMIALDLIWGYYGYDATNWGVMILYAFQRDAVVGGAWWWYAPPIIALCLLLTSSFAILDTLEKIALRGEEVARHAPEASPQNPL